jgi:hypothetical protein
MALVLRIRNYYISEHWRQLQAGSVLVISIGCWYIVKVEMMEHAPCETDCDPAAEEGYGHKEEGACTT